MGQDFKQFGRDEASAKRNFFDVTDFQTLAFFNGFNEVDCFQQRFVGAGVQPGKSAAQKLDFQVSPFQLGIVHFGYFQLNPG